MASTGLAYRVRFDVPETHCVRQGISVYAHCTEMPPPKQGSGIIQDPLTKRIMLKPFGSPYDFQNLSSRWRSANTSILGPWWLELQRGAPSTGLGTPFFANVKPAGLSASAVAITPSTSVNLTSAIVTGGVTGDTLVWALEGIDLNWVELDRGFAIQYAAADETWAGRRNWLAFQWDDILVRVSPAGECTVWQWDSAAATGTTPTLIDSFSLSQNAAGGVWAKAGWITIIPLQGAGMGVYACPPDEIGNCKNCHLVGKLRVKQDGFGLPSCWSRSRLRIAINPLSRYVLGVAFVRYSTTAKTYDEKLRALPVAPATSYETFNASVLNRTYATVTTSAKGSDFATWLNTSDRFRASFQFQTYNDMYTPHLTGWQATWAPQFASRNTTPWEAETLSSLSYTFTADGRWEGAADVRVRSALGRLALERGDMTYIVERATNAVFDSQGRVTSATWVAQIRGIAQVEGDVKVGSDTQGMFYQARLSMRDPRWRLGEINSLFQASFDGLSVRQAINTILYCAGFQPLLSAPSAADTIKVPSSGDGGSSSGPKWLPKPGEDGDAIIKTLLLMLRKKNAEYFLRWDLTANGFQVVQRAYKALPSDQWTLTTFTDEHSITSKNMLVSRLSITPGPPEASSVKVRGFEEGANAQSINQPASGVESQTLKNPAVLTDTTSRSFLGRVKMLVANVTGLSKQADVDLFARRLYDPATSARTMLTCESPYCDPGLRANDYVAIRTLNPAGTRAKLIDGWIMRHTITVATAARSGCIETSSYDVSSLWPSSL